VVEDGHAIMQGMLIGQGYRSVVRRPTHSRSSLGCMLEVLQWAGLYVIHSHCQAVIY
jgi:hypothetical protein